MNATFWFGLIGCITGISSILWNVFEKILDRPRLEVSLMKGKMYPDHTDKDYLVFSIVNVGRRPVLVTNLFGKFRTPSDGKPHFTITPRSLPKMLQEADYHVEYYDVAIPPTQNVKWYAASTSTGKKFKVPRKQMKRAGIS